MPSFPSKLISPVLAFMLACGLYAQMYSFAVTDDTTDFHARVKQKIDEIPRLIGKWEGTDAKPPEAAGKLLRPNVIFARRYLNSETNQWASLIVIHCRDSRDMSGHYPPYCYRGSGWTQAGPPDVTIHELWGQSVPIAAYEFSRTEFENRRNWVVYDFFVLPNGDFVTDMEHVTAASGDYRSRPYGCAQIQVLMDSKAPEADRREVLYQMLNPIEPVIRELQSARAGARP